MASQDNRTVERCNFAGEPVRNAVTFVVGEFPPGGTPRKGVVNSVRPLRPPPLQASTRLRTLFASGLHGGFAALTPLVHPAQTGAEAYEVASARGTEGRRGTPTGTLSREIASYHRDVTRKKPVAGPAGSFMGERA